MESSPFNPTLAELSALDSLRQESTRSWPKLSAHRIRLSRRSLLLERQVSALERLVSLLEEQISQAERHHTEELEQRVKEAVWSHHA